jgi:hypothetical protein
VVAHGLLDKGGLAGLGYGEDGVQPARFPVDAALPAGLDQQLPQPLQGEGAGVLGGGGGDQDGAGSGTVEGGAAGAGEGGQRRPQVPVEPGRRLDGKISRQ